MKLTNTTNSIFFFGFLLISYFIPSASVAGQAELFGASFSTSGIGNQANFNPVDPSNNYYVPALLGFSSKFNFILQSSSTTVDFEKINNITITNSTNSTSGSTRGNANLNYPQFYGNALHVGVPIGGEQHLGTLGVSIFTPLGKIVESDSGDPFMPEYVMYRSRYQRTSAYLNFAKKWDESLAFSLGTIVGFQATGVARTNMSLNGASYGSWARAQTKVSPSLGGIFSVVKIFQDSKFYFTYSQEMKSNLKMNVVGEITNPSLALFDASLSSLLFYDPHTFRLGYGYQWSQLEFFGGLEYQLWNSYKTPVISVVKTGGVIVPSSNYERIQTRDTINPRAGIKFTFLENWNALIGAIYRITPIKGDFSGSGNSIDSNTLIATAGINFKMNLFETDVTLGTSFQYHKLEDVKVTKANLQENGSAGEKIGGPGYTIGGHILAGSIGAMFNF